MKIVTGGQSGGDRVGNLYAKKHGIITEINAFEGFYPVKGVMPKDIKVNYVCNKKSYAENLKCRTKYNVVNSDFTIILLNKHIDKTRGSKLTFKECILNNKNVVMFNIYTRFSEAYLYGLFETIPIHYSDASVVLSEIKTILKTRNVINVAGQRDLNEEDGVKFLESILL